MKSVYVATDPHEKAMQRALIQYRDPKNYDLVKEALLRCGREDLIGFGRQYLIPPRKMRAQEEKSRAGGGRTAGKNEGTASGNRRDTEAKKKGLRAAENRSGAAGKKSLTAAEGRSGRQTGKKSRAIPGISPRQFPEKPRAIPGRLTSG
jgi:hypothetical protein